LALSFVLDRSGSMAFDKIEAAKMATSRALERLHPDDVVSVVTFDHIVEYLAAPARRAQQAGLMASLQEIDARGGTNLSGGWLRGRQDMQAAQGMISDLAGSSRRILRLTDGHANAGITEPATLIELARLARAQGITTTTIGIGEGYDDALLRAMADAGGGSTWYIEHPDQSHDVLAAEIGDLLSVSAQGVTVSLDLHEAVQIFVTHSDWPTHLSAAGRVHFDLGDLYAAEPKPLLVELFVPAHQLETLSATSTPLATLTVQGNVITASGCVEFRTVHLPIASTLEGQQLVVPEIEHAVLLARTAKAREAAARYQREGDAGSAERVMREATSVLESSPLASDMKYSIGGPPGRVVRFVVWISGPMSFLESRPNPMNVFASPCPLGDPNPFIGESRMRRVWSRSVVRAVMTGVVGLAVLTGGASAAVAQATGTLEGKVTVSGSGEALQGASVGVVGTQDGSITRADGTFRFSLRAGTYELRVRMLGYAGKTASITVSAGGRVTQKFVLDKSSTQLEAVAVTGSRGGARTVVSSPVPVDVINSSELRSTGRVETAQMLQAAAPSLNGGRSQCDSSIDDRSH
jgi:Ca-activated chloride channel family protein